MADAQNAAVDAGESRSASPAEHLDVVVAEQPDVDAESSATREGDTPPALSAPPDDPDEKWKTFPHWPGTARRLGGTWLGVKKDQKERPKALGAVWDAQEKQWYAPDGLDSALFAEWMLPHLTRNSEDKFYSKRNKFL